MAIKESQGTVPSNGGREHFASRLGFILISAGCAIGLGNVWRFPYIAGEYGGAAFILLYLIFLVILGLPVMIMEFAIGRASQRSCARAFERLQPSGKWNWFSWWAYIGCMILMMFYTVVCGWMLAYMAKMATGEFVGQSVEGVAGVFSAMLGSPTEMLGWMLAVIVIGFLVCSLGLQKGVERITKIMMICLLFVMVALVFRSVTLPGAGAGLEFYLIPDFEKMFGGGIGHFGEVVYAAMGQAFFTLSLGIGAMEVFGSRIATIARSRAKRCASAVSIRSWRSWRASSSFLRASRSLLLLIRGQRSCSLPCQMYSSRCPSVRFGERCSSCS